MAATPALLELVSVSRRLGGRAVLSGVTLAVRRGDVTGLVGVNGAGKSTTLAIMAGVLKPDAGEVRLEGHGATDDPRALHRRVGWVPEAVPLWPELTVSEALEATARLRGIARDARRVSIKRELARLDLESVARRLCGQLSLGQRRRVGLAQALLHEPDVLVLDEPANGLDPVQAAQLRALIGGLSPNRGIIFSTHDLAEVEATCNQAVILHAGRVRHDAPIDRRRGALETRFRAIVAQPVDAAA